jgi:hypothetical protein
MLVYTNLVVRPTSKIEGLAISLRFRPTHTRWQDPKTILAGLSRMGRRRLILISALKRWKRLRTWPFGKTFLLLIFTTEVLFGFLNCTKKNMEKLNLLQLAKD